MAKFVQGDKNGIHESYLGPDYLFKCVGCGCDHGIWTTDKNRNNAIWSFNEDLEKPTVSPSILVHYPTYREVKDGVGVKGTEYNHICHSFINDGKIQYLSDCTHELAGQTIDLPEYE